MNKLKLALVSFFLVAGQQSFAQITSPSPYCAAGYDDDFSPVDHHISNVTLGTLNNTTGAVQFAAPHYAYYNAITAPNLIKGNSYPISVTHDGGVSIHFVAVYIDYNHNNSFADPGELVLEQDIVVGNVTNPSTATIIIPNTATAGVTRMRVMVFEDDNYTWSDGNTVPTPCTADMTGSLDWGETEDYNVNITSSSTSLAPVAAFSGTPLTGTTSTDFTFTDGSTNAPTAWEWTFTPNTVVYQSGTTSTSTNPIVKFTSTGLYTAKLKVTNTSGADSLTRNNYISVVAASAVDFSVSPTTGSTATIFNFSDNSTNTPTAWVWTFTPNTVVYQGGTTSTSANPKVKFTTNGLYTVKLKATGTTGPDSLVKNNYITVGPTGISEIASANEPLFYPNPAKNILYFDNAKITSDIKSVSIYNIQGKEMFTSNEIKNNNINIESFPSGIYFVRIMTDDIIHTCRIAVEK